MTLQFGVHGVLVRLQIRGVVATCREEVQRDALDEHTSGSDSELAPADADAPRGNWLHLRLRRQRGGARRPHPVLQQGAHAPRHSSLVLKIPRLSHLC